MLATTKEIRGILPNYTSELKYLIGGEALLYSFKNSASLFNEDEYQGRESSMTISHVQFFSATSETEPGHS